MRKTSKSFEQIKAALLEIEEISLPHSNRVFGYPTIEQIYDRSSQQDIVIVSYYLHKNALAPGNECVVHMFTDKMNEVADILCDVDTSEPGFPKVKDKILNCLSNIKPPFVYNHENEAQVVRYEIPLTEETALKIRSARMDAVTEVGRELCDTNDQKIASLTSYFPGEDGKIVRQRILEYRAKQAKKRFDA